MINKIYAKLANLVIARQNCIAAKNDEWFKRHSDAISQIVRDLMPSGSGIDCGTKFDFGASTPDKLVFNASYHHMNDNGMYDGWTEHEIVVTPSLANGFDVEITGRNRRGIKDYLYDVYSTTLDEEITSVEKDGESYYKIVRP